tara:strand:+ start:18334 stop:18660 length:327 start_codon:yes stop_codon:yes gene_type:complete
MHKMAMVFVALLMPQSVAEAAPSNFAELVNMLTGWINAATMVLFSAAIAFFFWKVAHHLLGYDDSQNAAKKKAFRDTLIWGIIILFVMVSIWGIIAILQATLSLENRL